ncbi:unnamed protein product, partial [Porites evermanni]
MASCEFSKYVGGDCGASLVLPSGDLCVRISECSKDIKGHLKTCGVSDGTLCSEATLLLARAGKSNSIRVSPVARMKHKPTLSSKFQGTVNDEFTELYTGIMEMSLKDESLFVPDEDSVSSSDEESSTAVTGEPSNEYIRREHLNRFLETCNVQKLTRPRKRWAEAGARTHSNHVKKAKDVIVEALDVITPGDAAHLWDALQSSMLVDKELGYEGSADRKYLEALAETYKNASAWDTKRQVLSIMADLVPIERLQSATVRKSLQGIDYIAAEGGKACDDLCNVVKRLEEYGVHVSPSSPVADHCSVYALSDDKEPLFSSPCDHDHDRTCPQCEELTALVSAIQEYLEREDLGFPTAELDDLRHVADEAAQNILFCGNFQEKFSAGDFLDVGKEGCPALPLESSKNQNFAKGPEEAEFDPGLFQCPNEGCVKSYQSFSALEKHLSFGKCEMRAERVTLLDQARQLYRAKLTEGTSKDVTSHCAEAFVSESVVNTSQIVKGWALKQTKKSGRLSESQMGYLHEKFKIGQKTGYKQDPASVAHDMRYARTAEGERLFTRSEFLTAQQVQSYFSRQAGKLRNQSTEDERRDHDAAAEQQQYWDTREQILREVQLQHPITYDNFDLCEMYHASSLNKFSVNMLQ